jgi:acetoin utilization protein AcuB
MQLGDGMHSTHVYSCMTPSPLTIGRDQTLATAHDLMHEHHIRHLPVLDGGVLVGILSARDIQFDPSTLVEDAMTPDPYIVAADTPVRDVAKQMVDHKYGCAIVVDRGHVAGIFTTIDALRLLLAREG